jgi:tetratricopeptide (TPR) repeat protein
LPRDAFRRSGSRVKLPRSDRVRIEREALENMHTDRYGLALTTASDTAAAAYREGVDHMLSAWPGAAEALDRALAADPDFALAHIARARAAFVHADVATARAHVGKARALAERTGERERSHIEALALGMEGKPGPSLSHSLAHLDRWPRDAIVLSLPLGAFGLFAFSGIADHDAKRVELCERHARHYGDDWWFLTYLGWSYTENNQRGAGRQLTERALEKRRENANASHALAHAMFEDGDIAAAERLLADWLPIYDRKGILNGHISWHGALLALEQGDAAKALAIYQDRVAPPVSYAPPLNVVTDGASLLWRMHVYGHAVPEATWRETAAMAEKSFPKAGVHFADVHCAIAAAATGDKAGLARRVADLEARVAEGKLAPGSVVPALCRGIAAFAEEHYAEAAAILAPVAEQVVRIGGSHAQRELIEDTLAVAYMRGGMIPEARALVDRRLHRRPSPRDERWRAGLPAAA